MWPIIPSSSDESVYRLRTLKDRRMHRANTPAEKVKTGNAIPLTENDRLLCRQCLVVITSQSEQISVNGSFQHTFANPHGIVFEIGCFQNARGCGCVGVPTDEFTWFAGHYWQVAVCSSCLTHVGWRFSARDRGVFFGLILDRLVASTSTLPHKEDS